MIAGYLLYNHLKSKPIQNLDLISSIFILFIIIFIIGLFSLWSILFINILIFIIGLSIISNGTKQNDLVTINYGLLIISTLIICRFFDADINFLLKGSLFISIDISFFVTNLWIIKRRKSHE